MPFPRIGRQLIFFSCDSLEKRGRYVGRYKTFPLRVGRREEILFLYFQFVVFGLLPLRLAECSIYREYQLRPRHMRQFNRYITRECEL